MGGGRGGGGGGGGQHSQQAPDVITTPTRFLINQCQIIAFLILKSYIIQNSRIELRGIVLPEPSNHIKATFVITFLPFQSKLQRDTNLVTICLHCWLEKTSKKASTLEGKNLLLEEQILSFKS